MIEDEKREWLTCAADALYFVDRYCWIYDATRREWVPFRLWAGQVPVLDTLADESQVIILKARQLGMTWLCLAWALWNMLFRPAATVLIFSRRDDEAMYLLGDERLRGMYGKLPGWMRARSVLADSGHEWMLSNGSVARAFPTTAGDSYTASLAIVDEADLSPDLNRLMRAVKPTIDGGGQMVLLSRADKSKPESEFKAIYRGAVQGLNGWAPIFLPWHVRPERDEAWYEAQRRDILSRTGSDDDLHEQYPATDTEALSPRSLDKRISPAWLERCYVPMQPLATLPEGAPALPGLEVYALPAPGRAYVIGADPAEGNPTSDDSALTLVDAESGEECAALAGKFEPSTLAGHADRLARWYNGASVMVERNNHGHAVLLWLRDNGRARVLAGFDGKLGWHSTTLGKTKLYDAAADAFRDEETVLHSFASYWQLASIEGTSLRAPDGQHDDRADSYALALAGRQRAGRRVLLGFA